MRSKLLRYLTYLLLVMSISILWLFSPKPTSPGDYCGRYVSINAHMGFVVNCDAGTYAYPAESPARLMQKEEIRQSRPLYILLGTIVGYPISGIARLVIPGLDPRAPFHIGFTLLNFLILYASVLLFDALMSASGVDPLIIMPLAVVLVANDVTKAFVWTAHQQMFSLFTPLIALFIYQRIAASPAQRASRLWALSFALGFLPLVYGNFLVILPALLVADALACRRSREGSAGAFVPRLGLAVVAFLVPTFLWVVLVTLGSGSYYNHEMVVYRQLIWVLDAARAGGGVFLAQAIRYTRAYTATYLSIEMLPLGCACLILVVRIVVNWRAEQPAPDAGHLAARRIHQQGCLVVAACFFLFLWVLGFYQTRLTFSLVPLALCVDATEMANLTGTDRRKLRRLAWALVPASAAWAAYHVMKYGPFS